MRANRDLTTWLGLLAKVKWEDAWPSVVSGQRSLAGSRRARLKANILLVLLLLLLLVLVPILPRRRLGFVSPALPEWREHRRAGRPRPLEKGGRACGRAAHARRIVDQKKRLRCVHL